MKHSRPCRTAPAWLRQLLGLALVASLSACGTATAPMSSRVETSAGPSTARPADAPEPGSSSTSSGTAPATSSTSAASLPPLRCTDWLAAQARDRGQLYAVDGPTSQIRIHVFRAGRLASLGHNHVLGLDRLVGHAFVPRDGLAEAGVELGFRLEDLIIDRAEWRQALGAEFASQPSADDIAGTRTNLLRALEAAEHPHVWLRSRAVEGAWPRLVLNLAVQLHGQVRTLDLPLDVARPIAGDRSAAQSALRATGRLVIRQSDFGLKPFAVLGGLLAVQDPLVIDLDLVARPTDQCTAP